MEIPGNYLKERVKRIALWGLLCFDDSPKYQVRFAELRFKHDGDLSQVGRATGIKLETLQHQRDEDLDNPSYRFHRDSAFFSYLATRAEDLKGCSWLDVGADTGALSVYVSEILNSSDFALCDVHTPRKSNFPVRRIDGTRLDYADASFDLVFFSYVLHHAGDDAIPLLRDAHRIARRYVIVLEDPKETDADCRWAYQDDRRGTYRGRTEWLALFSAMGFSLILEEPLDCYGHSRHLFVLAP